MGYAEQIAVWNEKRQEFTDAHPNWCNHCDGWGVVGSGQMDRDTGIVDQDPCPHCADNGFCPWCGEETYVASDNGSIMCACGWVEGNYGVPEPPEPGWAD